MISFPTTSTGVVWKVRKSAHKEHPHHTRLGGVGVWCGGRNVKNGGGENRPSTGLKIQAEYRRAGGAS
jgi:hypothetical protein